MGSQDARRKQKEVFKIGDLVRLSRTGYCFIKAKQEAFGGRHSNFYSPLVNNDKLVGLITSVNESSKNFRVHWCSRDHLGLNLWLSARHLKKIE